MSIQSFKRISISPLITVITLGVSFTPPVMAAPAFRDVTASAGIESTREETISVSWVDFDNDGKPDLWISPHGYRSPDRPEGEKFPSLYLNQGSGQFTNIISSIWPVGITEDTHGSTWTDFDNDNDPDLFVLSGADAGSGSGPKLFFVNNNGQLQERAVALGLDYPRGRGRSALWFDWNKDGLLDVLLTTAKRPDGLAPTALFTQTATGFKDDSARVGLRANETSFFAQLADLSGDGKLDIVIQDESRYPQKFYDITTVPFRDLTLTFPAYSNVSDAVIADFNGDLHSDVFLTRNKSSRASSIFQADANVALANLLTNGKEVGVSFQTNGNVFFDFRTSPVTKVPVEFDPSQIFIGSNGRHPTNLGFSLSPNDLTTRGIKPHTPGSSFGLYIGYDPVSKSWKTLLSSPKYKDLNLVIETTEPLSNMNSIGFGSLNLSQHDLQDVLLLHNSTTKKYVDQIQGSGLGNPVLGQSAVAGDFDNDMDVDLYVSRAYKTFNLPSILYENKGDGTFTIVPNAGGAAGVNLGFHFSALNTKFIMGSRIAVADYDVDGFLDLFVSNTNFRATQKTYLGSPHQLFRNLGNNNHWIEIDLKGVVSNRDGIGARVLVTAGGVTQLREQTGGMHLFSQDQQQIHFGLGNNSQINLIEIQWPSGTVQKLFNVPADQVLKVVEGN